MKGTGAKRNVCPGSCVSTGAKFPDAPVESAPMFLSYVLCLGLALWNLALFYAAILINLLTYLLACLRVCPVARQLAGAVYVGTVQGALSHVVYRLRSLSSSEYDRRLAYHRQHVDPRLKQIGAYHWPLEQQDSRTKTELKRCVRTTKCQNK